MGFELPVVAAIAILTLGICIPVAISLQTLWSGNQFYGHAYAIPVVSAFLVWARRREIRRSAARPRNGVTGQFKNTRKNLGKDY